MILFYLIVAAFFLGLGSLFTLRPALMKRVMHWILSRSLFPWMGIVEIALGLGTLYFRHQSQLLWFSYLAGFMFFIDGVLYMLTSEQIRSAYEWFLKMEDRALRTYGIFLFVICVGFFLSGFSF